MEKAKVFIAYSRKDQQFREELVTSLMTFVRTEEIEIWYDGSITHGQKWDHEILEHLLEADITILLISANFIASDYAYLKEFRYALQMMEIGEMILVPVLVRESLYKQTPIGRLQVVPSRPISSSPEPDKEYVKICENLKNDIDKVRYRKEGLRLLAGNEYREAIESFNQAISIDKQFASAYLDRAAAYIELGDIERASLDNNKAVSLNANLSVRSVLGKLTFEVLKSTANIQRATGFIISADGYAITTSGNINNTSKDMRWGYGGTYHPAECLHQSNDQQWAVLKLDLPDELKFDAKFLRIGYMDAQDISKLAGRQVTVAGYSNGLLKEVFLEGKINVEPAIAAAATGVNRIGIKISTLTDDGFDFNGAPIVEKLSRKIIGIVDKGTIMGGELSGIIFSEGFGGYLREKSIPSSKINTASNFLTEVLTEPLNEPVITPVVTALSSVLPKPITINPYFPSIKKFSWGLNSTLVKAWINDANTEITIIGKGTSKIRETIEREALSLLVFLEVSAHCIITSGFIYLSASNESDNDADSLIQQVTRLAGEQHHPQSRVSNAIASIRRFGNYLRNLENTTGLVEVIKDNEQEKQQFLSSLRIKGRQVISEQKVVVIPPGKDENKRFILLEPYKILSRKAVTQAFAISLPADVLATKEYRDTLNKFYRDKFIKLHADIKRRLSFWQERLATYKSEKAYYHSLSPAERINLPPVKIAYELNRELQILVPIPPEQTSAVTFYNGLDRQIELANKYIGPLQIQLGEIESKLRAPDSAIERVFAGTLFDCALRGCDISTDKEVNESFVKWKKMVFAGLKEKWDKALEAAGIDAKIVFSAHSLFSASISLTKNIVSLSIHAIYDPCLTTVVLNPANRVAEYRDPTDSDHASFEDFGNSSLYQQLKRAIESYNIDSLKQEYDDLLRDTHKDILQQRAFDRAYRCLKLSAMHSMDEIVNVADGHENGPLYLAKALYLYQIDEFNTTPFAELITQRLNHKSDETENKKVIKYIDLAIRYDEEFAEEFSKGILLTREYRKSAEQSAAAVLKVVEGMEIVNEYESAVHSLRLGEKQNSMFLKLASAFELSFGATHFDFPISPLFDECWRIVSQAPANHDYFGKI